MVGFRVQGLRGLKNRMGSPRIWHLGFSCLGCTALGFRCLFCLGGLGVRALGLTGRA